MTLKKILIIKWTHRERLFSHSTTQQMIYVFYVLNTLRDLDDCVYGPMNKKINIKIFRSEVQFLTEQILMNKAIFQMCIISTFELKKCLKSKKFFNFNCLSSKFYNKKNSFHKIQKIKKSTN